MDSAVANRQHVLNRHVQHQKPVVLLIEHVVAAVRRLLCALHILLPVRLKLDGLIRAAENVQQVRQHPLNRVLNVGRDDLAPAFFLVAVGHAVILAQALFTLLRKRTVDVAGGGIFLAPQHLQQFFVVQFHARNFRV